MSDQTEEKTPQDVPDWKAWLPDWGKSAVVVLERGTELSASLSAEFRLLQQTQRLNGSEHPSDRNSSTDHPLEFISVSGSTSALQLIRERSVVALVLNLETHCRESLVLLRQLLTLSRSPELAAVGSLLHEELRTLLLEAGCPLLLTDPPFDVMLAGWLHRVLIHKHSRTEKSTREE